MGWIGALLLKPFFLLGYLLFVRSIELSIARLPDCRFKRALLRRW